MYNPVHDRKVIILYYLIYYMTFSVLVTFLPIYLTESAGVTSAQLGFLMAAGPVAAVAVQPFWGMKADRAKYKNTILLIILTGTLAASVLIPLHTNFWYMAVTITLLHAFMTGNNPITDAITVELCQKRSWDFGRIRMAGAVGYSSMGLIAGIIISGIPIRLFPIFAVMMVFSITAACFLPKVPGYQREKLRAPYLKLLKNKRLVIVLSLSFIANYTLGMHYSFYGVYFRELGGTTALLGLAAFCASILELPFAFFSKRIIDKLGGPEKTLLASITVMTLRWALVSQAASPVFLLFVNCLHGFSFIVLAITITVFIGEHVPPEMKASGQTLNGMLAFGVSRILGSVTGGMLIGSWGISGMFLTAALVNMLGLLVFVPLVFKKGG